MATTLEQLQQATQTDLLTTELNSLASGSFATLGAAFNNVQATANFNGYPRCNLQMLLAAYTGTPAAGAALYIWFIRTVDGGSTYEDSASTIGRTPDVIIPVDAVASGPLKRIMPRVKLPAGNFKTLAQSVGLGLSLAASGNKITIDPETDQGV